jgi:hypothetical protein
MNSTNACYLFVCRLPCMPIKNNYLAQHIKSL